MSAQSQRGRSGQVMRFKGRVAVVTGAAAGIGAAVARALSEEGATVAVFDVAAEDVTNGSDVSVDAHQVDVTDRTDVTAAVDAVLEKHGRIDILVNNAGVSTLAPVVELAESDWDRVMAVNAKGTFLCCQAVLVGMLDRNSGSIVNVASQAGRHGERFIAHYCAAKAAVLNFSRALALEVAPHVRVNSVCPGFIETAMTRSSLEAYGRLVGEEPEALLEARRRAIPLQRFQQPLDVAEAVLFLASDAASEITGQALDVSGGEVMS